MNRHDSIGPATVERTEIARLREELEAANQRLEVALAIHCDIAEFVEDEPDQALVIADVVRQWRTLTPEEQANYAVPGSCDGPLARFAGEFFDKVNWQPFPPHYSEDHLPDREARRILENHWWDYVARLRKEAGS